MLVTRLIERLYALRKDHGECEVVTMDWLHTDHPIESVEYNTLQGKIVIQELDDADLFTIGE